MNMEERQIRIIIADDLEAHRRRLERILAKEDDLDLVYAAKSGEEAAVQADRLRPDIVLMDVEMEESFSGIDAAMEINKKHPDIRIIILSVHNDEKVIYSAFQTGIVDFLLKSEGPEAIVQAIHSAMDNASPIRPYIADRLRSDYRRSRRSEESLMKTIKLLADLTPGELTVIRLLKQGMKRKEVADSRFVTEDTIKKQINSILKKCRKRNTRELIAEMEDFGIFSIIDEML